MDKFTIEAVDLGQLFKIRVRHDNSMIGADWYLDQVEVLDVETEEVYMFLCERWLSTKKEDKRIDRTFYIKVVFRVLYCFLLCVRASPLFHRRKWLDVLILCLFQGYEGERSSDPYSKMIAQSKLGLDRNANKKKKKKKAAVTEEGPSKDARLFLVSFSEMWDLEAGMFLGKALKYS